MTADEFDMPFLVPEDDGTLVKPPRTARPGEVVLTKPLDPTRQRRNRLNRNRGKGTSRELADYLGWQNVEAAGWKWDVQAPAGRLQSKRDATGRSSATCAALIVAITPGDYLRGLFLVAPRQRLASGTVTVLLEEWVGERGWSLPRDAVLTNAIGTPLLTMSLALFRDLIGAPQT